MPYELIEEEVSAPEESTLSQIGRGVARTASRVGEQIAGAPGDIFSLINEFIAKPAVEFATGKPGVSYEETPLGKLLPPTEKHRQATKAQFGEYTEPQNKYEKFVDDIFQDAAAIALPGSKGQMAKNVFSSLAKSVGSNLVSESVKDITADEKKAAYGKLSSLFLLSMFDKKSAAKAVGELYKPLQETVGKLKPVQASFLQNSLNNLKNKMKLGTQAPSEKFVIDEIDAILPKIKNGMISPEELWASKRSLNEKLSKVLYDIPKKSDQARARKLAKTIGRDLDDTLKETVKQDPKFYKQLKRADQAFGVIAESNLVEKFIEKNIKYNPLTSGLIHVLAGPIGSYASTAALPYQVGKILYRISKSPELAKHYGKVLSAAANEQIPIMNHELKKLDKKLQEQDKKTKYQLVD